MLLTVIGLGWSGCRPPSTQFEIVSFKNPTAAEHYLEPFRPGCFSRNAHNNWELTFEAGAPATDLSSSGVVADETSNPSAANLATLSQFIYINVFWCPVPGTTFAERTQTNATIIYGLQTGRHAILYKGAGFVYFTLSRDGTTLEGQIESSDLLPTNIVNEPVDLFGPCRVQGTFTARKDRHQVVTVLRRLRQLAGPALDANSPESAK